MPRTKKVKTEAKETKPEIKETKVEAPKFVVIESADNRVLECIINSIPYSGKVLKVPADRAEGIKEVLMGAGYLLK